MIDFIEALFSEIIGSLAHWVIGPSTHLDLLDELRRE